MSKAKKAVKKVGHAVGDVVDKTIVDPTKKVVKTMVTDPLKKIGSKTGELVGGALGVAQGAPVINMPANEAAPLAPVAPIMDDAESLRAKQKSLQRRMTGGRASTIFSGGSSLG